MADDLINQLLQQRLQMTQQPTAKLSPGATALAGLGGQLAGVGGFNAVQKINQNKQSEANQALDQNKQAIETSGMIQKQKQDLDAADPLSPRSVKAREAAKKVFSTLGKAYGLQMNPNDFDIEGLSESQLGTLKLDDIVKHIAENANAKKKAAAQAGKEDESDYRESRKAVQSGAMAAVAGGRGTTQTVGRAVSRLQNANNMLQLLTKAKEAKDIKPDSPLATELSIGIASLLSGSSSPAESTIKSLIPKTAQGSIADMKQYITGNPQVFLTSGRIDQMLHTLGREKEFWSGEKNKFGAAYRKSLQPYFKKYPDLEQAFDETISAAAGDTSLSAPGQEDQGWTPEKQQRLDELRAKKAAGTLGK